MKNWTTANHRQGWAQSSVARTMTWHLGRISHIRYDVNGTQNIQNNRFANVIEYPEPSRCERWPMRYVRFMWKSATHTNIHNQWLHVEMRVYGNASDYNSQLLYIHQMSSALDISHDHMTHDVYRNVVWPQQFALNALESNWIIFFLLLFSS